MSRPRPVVIVGAIGIGLDVLATSAYFADLVSANVLAWIIVASTVYGAVSTYILQGLVTPVSDPMDDRGRRLVPLVDRPSNPRTPRSVL